MRTFTIFGLLTFLVAANQVFAQFKGDDPNLDQIPYYLRDRANVQNDAPLSTIVTINNWDNFSLGVDFAENNIAENPAQPTWYFTAYNTNAPHNTENGLDWYVHTANFGASMQGDPIVAYDSIGNLYYENMYGSSIAGCKVLKSTDNGNTWGPSVTAIAGNDKNWMACDQTAGPYANYVYSTMTNNGSGNFTRSMDHGATWTSTFAPSTQSLPGMMVCVGPQGDVQGGSVYVVTNSGNSFAATYTFYRSNDGGATFSQRSSVQWAGYVGSNVGGRNSVSNMRTRPYPMIAADNSYGANRGKFYCVYASNDPPGNGNKSDVWCRASSDGGATWGSPVKVNDDANTQNFQQWHPAIWCDKETGKLYAMWMDTRDTPTNDSAFIYASYSTDGGATWVTNQRISNKKMKIDCGTCGGGGTPRYEGDYNGIVSNAQGGMVAWTDFRSGNFQSMTAYFPDFAMAIDHDKDTLYTSADNAIFDVSIPDTKLYSGDITLSGSVFPVPTAGSITFEFPQGPVISTIPGNKPVKVVLTGNVPVGNYQVSFIATGPNGTPVHKRTATVKILQGANFLATASANPTVLCQGQTSQLNVVQTGGTAPFTYNWTPATGLSNSTLQNPVATPDASTTYKVVVTDNTGHTAVDSVAIVVNTPPAAPGPITGSQSVCPGDTTQYSIVEVAGGTVYNWSVDPPATEIIGNGTPNVSIVWGATAGEIHVLAGNDCGNNPIPSILPVEMGTLPYQFTAVQGPSQVCAGASAMYFVHIMKSAPAEMYYNWTVPADVTINSGQGTESINVTWGTNPGTVSMVASTNCGTALPVSTDVTITEMPGPAGAISGQDTICTGTSNIVFSVPAVTNATSYEWTLPEGAIVVSGSGTSELVLSFTNLAQSGDITVKGTNVCGAGASSTFPVVLKNCTGIGEQGLEASVRIFPNPVRSELTIAIDGREKELDLSLTNATGKTVVAEHMTGIPAGFTKKIDMSAFPAGVYLLKLSNGTRSYTEKVVVQ